MANRSFLLPGGQKTGPPGAGLRVTDVARKTGVLLNTRCGHHGICSGCLVELVAGKFQVGAELYDLTGTGPAAAGLSRGGGPLRAKACQTEILTDDYTIAVPRRSLVEAGGQGVASFTLPPLDAREPVLRRANLALRKPGMADSASDHERVLAALREAGFTGSITFPLAVLRQLPHRLPAAGYHVEAVLCRTEAGWEVQDVLPPEPGPPRLLGVAIDIGTTTVAAALLDVASGQVLATATAYNQQVSLSADVAQRIVDGSTEAGLQELQRLLVEESLNPLIEFCCHSAGVAPGDVRAVGIAANNIMVHLLLGISPEAMGGAPFLPAVNAPPMLAAAELGLATHPRAQVRILPAISAYIGGDITAGLLVGGVFARPDRTLFLDIGTNGEMVLSVDGRLIGCATPAGPAFEGGDLTAGTRGAVGAVERIRLDPATGRASYEVIGRVRPYGICGSAYIDFLAEGLRTGWLNQRGRFRVQPAGTGSPGTPVGPSAGVANAPVPAGGPSVDGSAPADGRSVDRSARTGGPSVDGPVSVTVEGGKRRAAFRIVPRHRTDERREDLVVTEQDVATLLQAKAAIFSGIVTLLEYAGLRPADLQQLQLAGGFAQHLRLEAAMVAGLLPEMPLERIRVLGNTALGGAAALLLHHGLWEEARRGVREVEVIELNQIPSFEANFVNALFLPNLDLSLFPEVAAQLPTGRPRPRNRPKGTGLDPGRMDA